MGLVDERPALDEHQPLGRALSFWSAIDETEPVALGPVGLAGLEEVPVRYLSTGQRKRAAFARLLAQRADNWLLDEPLNGLDTEGVALVGSLIANHRAQGGVVVIASHQPVTLPDKQVIDVRDHPL